MRDYKKYDVWIKGHELTLFVYKNIIPQLPKSEQYELCSQVKRASYSIPLSIVEGCGRNTEKDFAHFFRYCIRVCTGSRILFFTTK